MVGNGAAAGKDCRRWSGTVLPVGRTAGGGREHGKRLDWREGSATGMQENGPSAADDRTSGGRHDLPAAHGACGRRGQAMGAAGLVGWGIRVGVA